MSTEKFNQSTFENDLRVDPNFLDIEWMRQPSLYFKYAKILADSDLEVKKCKENLEIIDAKIDSEIRQKAEGLPKKPTEASIKADLTADKRHIEAMMDLNDALYDYQVCQAAARSLDHHKKASLENLVKLFIAQYYSGPKEVIDINERGKMFEKSLNARQKKLKNYKKGE